MKHLAVVAAMVGLVGYLYAGSTVDSCTNELNIASLNASSKCGGIAIISQGGTGTAVIRNCENTAAVQFIHVEGTPAITASGVNKGHAGYVSNDKIGGVANLYFATVEGDVATFVADDALALKGAGAQQRERHARPCRQRDIAHPAVLQRRRTRRVRGLRRYGFVRRERPHTLQRAQEQKRHDDRLRL